jgi:hypothetical protein
LKSWDSHHRKHMNALNIASAHRLEKTMLHKNSDEDVLICYGRGALPLGIPAAVMRQLECPDRQYLASFYRQSSTGESSGGERDFDTDFRLRTVPPSIAKEAAQSIRQTACQTILQTHYRELNDGYVLDSPYINEIDEAVLSLAFGAHENWITDIERVRISEIVARTAAIKVPDVYYVTFYNDLRNYFFYRKHHEHVPGTMLIEAARQGYYAQFYTATGVRPGEVSISMDSLHADFSEYTNPNYPVRIMIEDADPQLRDNNRRQIHKRATFQQTGKVVGRIEMKGHVMRMREFKRMRNLRFDPSHRFSPVKNVGRTILLDDLQGKRYECVLNELGLNGFSVTLDKRCDFAPGRTFHYLLFVDGLGFIDGQAEFNRKREDEKSLSGDFSIVKITDDSEDRLCEVIKNYTYVVPTGIF